MGTFCKVIDGEWIAAHYTLVSIFPRVFYKQCFGHTVLSSCKPFLGPATDKRLLFETHVKFQRTCENKPDLDKSEIGGSLLNVEFKLQTYCNDNEL